MNRSQLLSLSLLLVCLSSTSFVEAKTYYKWVDDSGVTHYSEQKPYDKPSEEVQIKGGRQTTVDSNTKEQPKNTAAKPAAATTSAGQPQDPTQNTTSTKNSQRCDGARKNLETLKTYPRVRFEDADGVLRYMEDAEKEQRIKDFQAVVDEAC